MRGWIAALVVVVACAGPPARSATATSAGRVAASPTTAQAQVQATAQASPEIAQDSTTAQPQATTDWPTYQHDSQRSGVASGAYDPTNANQLWETAPLDEQIYAQPIVVGSSVFVATENNTVYALDAATGSVIWSQHLGDPVPRSTLPCGNIDPTGITGTPVADPTAGLLYAVDYLKDGPHHELIGLDLNTGDVRFHEPIDPPGANPLPLQQRGALGLANGTVYVPLGGLFGDCGPYHGWVVSASAADGRQRAVYRVPTQREGAIWAATSFDAAGDLYAATGNGSSTNEFDGANAVIHLSSDLKLLDFFAPSNWAELSRRDADLGSAGPVLLENGRVLQVGKSGVAYLLSASALGQIGGELFQAPVCNAGAYGGAAHADSIAYIACRDGLYAVQAGDSNFSVLWRGPQFNAGAPALTDTAVWTIDDGAVSLYALDRQTGNVLFKAPGAQGSNPPHFLTPAAAGGRVFHSRGRSIVAYGSI
jgi:outer membrane protein assembly factor BamB